MLTDQYFMQQAMKEAKYAASIGEIPVGAVIVGHQQIIAKTHNQTEQLGDVTAHAELLAITAAADYLGSKYLRDCTLYVTLEPCPMCAGALAWSQIGKIVFAASDAKRGYQCFSPNLLHPKTIVKSGLLDKESKDLLQDFFKQKRQ